MKHKWLMCFILSFFLMGCFGDSNKDVEAFLKSVKEEKKSEIPPLPEVKEYKSVNYDVILMKDPFQPYSDAVLMDGEENLIQHEGEALQRPDADRQRELLEYYPLDSFSMVGTIRKGKTFWGILKDKMGMLHKVRVGNYIGENSGRIEKITEKEILIKELVSSGEGDWVERVTTLHIIQ